MENKEINMDILTRRAEESVKAVQKISESYFDAVILQGQAAMKSVLLINAGVVVSVLAFYSGHVDLMLSVDSRVTGLYKMMLGALCCCLWEWGWLLLLMELHIYPNHVRLKILIKN